MKHISVDIDVKSITDNKFYACHTLEERWGKSRTQKLFMGFRGDVTEKGRSIYNFLIYV